MFLVVVAGNGFVFWISGRYAFAVVSIGLSERRCLRRVGRFLAVGDYRRRDNNRSDKRDQTKNIHTPAGPWTEKNFMRYNNRTAFVFVRRTLCVIAIFMRAIRAINVYVPTEWPYEL